ncbi:transposase [Acinetobacter baumannii]|uniref:transposase n=1 Tax=Acinetobacter baumannii TaxID=470 RepID=UPI003891D0E0
MGAVVSDPNGLTWAATLVPLAVTIPTAGHVVIFKRDPRSATLWVLLIALLPLGGSLLVRHQPFDTKQCRQVIADSQAHAVIPPRKNAKPWKDTKSSSLERNELLRTVKRFSRTLWKKWSGYHRRSLVETKMHCIKLLGDKLSARNFQSQVNEIHARVAVLNRFTELGRPHTQVVS